MNTVLTRNIPRLGGILNAVVVVAAAATMTGAMRQEARASARPAPPIQAGDFPKLPVPIRDRILQELRRECAISRDRPSGVAARAAYAALAVQAEGAP